MGTGAVLTAAAASEHLDEVGMRPANKEKMQQLQRLGVDAVDELFLQFKIRLGFKRGSEI